MKAADANHIAKLHCNVFKFHDELNWRAFKKSVAKYLLALGYERKKAKKASFHVMKAYQYADKAAAAQEQGKKGIEEKMYYKTLKEFVEAHKKIGVETQSPKYKVGWYEAARHKNHAMVLWNLFKEHFAKFGFRKLWLALECTYITFFKAYEAHNTHNWLVLEKILREYWRKIKKHYKRELPIEL